MASTLGRRQGEGIAVLRATVFCVFAVFDLCLPRVGVRRCGFARPGPPVSAKRPDWGCRHGFFAPHARGLELSSGSAGVRSFADELSPVIVFLSFRTFTRI